MSEKMAKTPQVTIPNVPILLPTIRLNFMWEAERELEDFEKAIANLILWMATESDRRIFAFPKQISFFQMCNSRVGN